ncbi:FtsH protease activity modulator HflK [Bacteroides acidifaciens]|uniref:FtsH protease activity modulator HflK n=1 Tax=Bacteroides acidifaciens TaxID=85831 RepID=UPI0025A93F9D|nr:FtsH protease activity modulator HflK [Bacteroides acidifaciens]
MEEKDFESSYKAAFEKERKAIGIAAWVITGLFICVLWFFAGHYTLTEEQDAVVYTFGVPKVVSKTGWNWNIPFVQKVTKVPRSILGMTIGYDAETGMSIYEESLMITKDLSFVNVDLYIEYRVSDPIKAVINKDSYQDIIKNLGQSYLRDTVGMHLIDDVITTGKAQIQQEIEEAFKQRIADEDLGYNIERVLIQDTEFPSANIDEAFKAVESAKQSMDVAINDAEKDKNEKIPAMEAEVDKIVKEAEAYKQEKINEANAQVARFEALYTEYAKFPRVTRKRIFYETMDEILPDLKVVINASDGTQSILPLDSFSSVNVEQTIPQKANQE